MNENPEYYQDDPAYYQKYSAFQSPRDMYGTAIITLTDAKDELHKLECALRGLIKASDGRMIQAHEPLLNDSGVVSVLFHVQSIMSKHTFMNHLEHQDVRNFLRFFVKALVRDLMINKYVYEIGKTERVKITAWDSQGKPVRHEKYTFYNPAARDKIARIAIEHAYICMKKAEGGGDRQFWSRNFQEIKQTLETNQKKQGLLGKLNPFGQKQ